MAKTIFEKLQEGQRAYSLPSDSLDFQKYMPPQNILRCKQAILPEISELDLMRHFNGLAKKNMGIDTNFYPLGSCTMKYNPRINELCANLKGFIKTHPFAPENSVQGNLQLIFELIEILCDIVGMSAGTLLPNAGAQGEFVGIRMISEYHKKNGELQRDEILIPDSAHGTNPATAQMAGFKTIPIRTNVEGDMDLNELRKAVSNRTAGLMLTNPNTLGLFSSAIHEVCDIIHEHGGLVYYDGANLNAIMYISKPAAMGCDVMHINLHKTFSTPHGGGGPGSGPVLCNDKLKPFLPLPRVEMHDDNYSLVWNDQASIGNIASFHGNFAIYLRAYIYAKLHGKYGLRRISEQAVLNANYLKKRLSKLFKIPFPQPCMHEFVAQADNYLQYGVKALDIAKRLLDYGLYAPTIYFPLIIRECMLIEPTETESKATLDFFIDTLETIVQEIQNNPELVKTAPHHMSVGRLNEVQAAKHPILREIMNYEV